MKNNNRGYMLVEIILATAIAFGIAYFMLNMTIKLKNKNDDLLVETLATTDQAIIANAIMNTLKGKSCEEIAPNINDKSTWLIKVDGNKVIVNGKVIDVVNSYISSIELKNDFCTTTSNTSDGSSFNTIHINIPITVKQIKERNFNIKLDWVLDD